MDWTQAFAIIGATGAFILWAYSKLDSDIKSLGTRMDQHSARIDQLYQMFIDLLKDKK